jgi:hypothetical protein
MSKELIDVNPARLIKGPKAKKFESDYYTIEQIAQLWQACKGAVVDELVNPLSFSRLQKGFPSLPLPGAEEVKKAKKDEEFACKTLAFFTPS